MITCVWSRRTGPLHAPACWKLINLSASQLGKWPWQPWIGFRAMYVHGRGRLTGRPVWQHAVRSRRNCRAHDVRAVARAAAVDRTWNGIASLLPSAAYEPRVHLHGHRVSFVSPSATLRNRLATSSSLPAGSRRNQIMQQTAGFSFASTRLSLALCCYICPYVLHYYYSKFSVVSWWGKKFHYYTIYLCAAWCIG